MHDVSRICAYLAGSRSTVVELYAIAIVSSSYPYFYGCLLSVSLTHTVPVTISFDAHLVLGVLVDWTSSLPTGDFFTGVAAELALAYYAISVFLNTILSFMICYRILQHGMKIRKHLGHEYASSYFAVVALVVESVLPYTLCGIAALVSLGVGSTTSEAFISVYVMMMVRSR